ncbi:MULTISPECIES: Rrf2 family transcriptional regulator [Bacillus cereus group]|uniref:Rrf2 family transcriptional regulator n=1 Tax=Bacillus cereus group TaxID=86661 RepID=UPI00103976BC|nr:Rrf2 family transcriptional regulator [Bacillus thuringiensis]MBJ8204367.1 Rrf2 family transcriptional regulator [Bacillus cereus]TBX40093.1 Rrf2 family transcriptional regulator [Bacillus thuringiensis]
MKISIILTVALQILSILKKNSLTPYDSEFIGRTLSIHPKIIRGILLCLKDTGMIHNNHKDDEWYLIKDVNHITLLDVYRSVCKVEGEICSLHENLKFNCPIGANIQFALEIILIQAQDEIKKILGNVTIGKLITTLNNENQKFK